KTVNDNFEEYKELIAKSKSDHGEMDELIAKAFNLADGDAEFLKELDEATLDGMLKSQQSKRSRAKSKVMTMDNYRTMMIGAIADADAEVLKEIDKATLDGMLKSQKSKRSRSKSKVMTMDNCRTMMIGAIAENLIRLVTGKKKSAGGNRRKASKVEYSAEELA